MRPAVIVREVQLAPDEAFARVTDWPRHGDHVPLTAIRVTTDGFVARTGVGPLAFDDPMRITSWDPPHHCRLEKLGSVVLGWATIDVDSAAQGSRVTWTEQAHVRGVPGLLAPLERGASTRLFGRVLDLLLRT